MTEIKAANVIFKEIHTIEEARRAIGSEDVTEIRRIFGFSAPADPRSGSPELMINAEETVAAKYAAASAEEKRLLRCFRVSFKTLEARDRLIRSLERSELIEAIMPDREIQLFDMPAIPNDQNFPQLWGLHKTNVGKVWHCSTGCGQVVAIVDTGIDINHDDLKHQLWEYMPGINGLNLNDGAGFFNLVDGNGHGTHVAGTVAARGNNVVGVVGVAPEARLMGMRIFGANPATFSMGANGIFLAAALRADVINCSWGAITPFDAVVAAAIAWAVVQPQRPVIVVAAGNANIDAAGVYPANDPNVICIGATDPADAKAAFSNWGTTLEASAPGVNIVSTLPGNNYGALSGTSMAAPHVSAMVAIIRSRLHGLMQSDYLGIVQTYVEPVNSGVPMGAGRIDFSYLEEILCGCGCSPCAYRSVLEGRALLNARKKKQFTVTSANYSAACALLSGATASGQSECTTLQIPDFAPCFSLHWGDGPNDQLETHDTEIIYITVCNPYCNLSLKDLKIIKLTVSPNAVLPNGEMAVEIAASSLICYGDLGPSTCATREYALLINNAAVGPYTIGIEYCIEQVELHARNSGSDHFTLNFVDS
jgi:thermitase